ncbi:MAG: deoxyribodipyrimidine photo-lyase [Anaerolineae bacterium]|jgi:deoxyribodipyrimidine photo-lyase
MKTAIWWLRRDLRLTDNQALDAALERAEAVVPVFVLDPTILDRPTTGSVRVAFLLEGLRHLDAALRERGSRLVVRRGDPVDELAAVVEATGARAILAEVDFTPHARARDDRVARQLPLERVGGRLVHPPGTILKADGDPYVVYTHFARKWKARTPPTWGVLLPAPDRIPTPEGVDGLPIPEKPALPGGVPFPSGEAEARRRLSAFASGDDAPLYRYAERRNRVDLDATSRLSPYLHLGMLSSRQVVVGAREAMDAAPGDAAREGAETWLDELVWREFFVHILYHFPHVLEKSFRETLRSIRWAEDEAAFAAWCEGRTGYPLVDAAMRQLNETGWMHNRARMVVGSFLVKDLLINWQRGETYFMRRLVDGDWASNNGGWQWVAGTGTDAAPYFRIFNPVSQSKKHDPNGAYIRRWVPELGAVPDPFIHAPWEMPEDLARNVGCEIGVDYPAPVVDHARARERTLAAYRAAREE